ncbi:MAG: hypothetical protein PWP19_1800, partial [Thermococcaceae archaeon]|nr:hypothetical protein [Thermococcaceae archaeon]
FRVFESVIPSGDHDNHPKEFSKTPNKGYYKHALMHGKLFKLTLKIKIGMGR